MKRWSRWLGLALVACGAADPQGAVARRDGALPMDGAGSGSPGVVSTASSAASAPSDPGAAADSSAANGAPSASPAAEGSSTPLLIEGAPPGAGEGDGPAPAKDPPTSTSTAGAEPPAVAASTCNSSGAAGPATPTIWVIGDSTASVYTSELYPRMGWAQPLQDYFSSACATIADRAISGRSSKSFFDEGAWAPVRDGLRAGDYVLIQFGHNDEKSDDPTRFTDPFTTFEQYLSIYIDDALAKSATPVLLTPIQRNKWNGAVLSETHGQYPEAMRQLAAAREVTLIDAGALTRSYFQRLGPAATTRLFMDLAVGQFPNYPDGNDDDTHLQEQGARSIAQLILADFSRQGLPLGRLVSTQPVAP